MSGCVAVEAIDPSTAPLSALPALEGNYSAQSTSDGPAITTASITRLDGSTYRWRAVRADGTEDTYAFHVAPGPSPDSFMVGLNLDGPIVLMRAQRLAGGGIELGMLTGPMDNSINPPLAAALARFGIAVSPEVPAKLTGTDDLRVIATAMLSEDSLAYYQPHEMMTIAPLAAKTSGGAPSRNQSPSRIGDIALNQLALLEEFLDITRQERENTFDLFNSNIEIHELTFGPVPNSVIEEMKTILAMSDALIEEISDLADRSRAYAPSIAEMGDSDPEALATLDVLTEISDELNGYQIRSAAITSAAEEIISRFE